MMLIQSFNLVVLELVVQVEVQVIVNGLQRGSLDVIGGLGERVVVHFDLPARVEHRLVVHLVFALHVLPVQLRRPVDHRLLVHLPLVLLQLVLRVVLVVEHALVVPYGLVVRCPTHKVLRVFHLVMLLIDDGIVLVLLKVNACHDLLVFAESSIVLRPVVKDIDFLIVIQTVGFLIGWRNLGSVLLTAL